VSEPTLSELVQAIVIDLAAKDAKGFRVGYIERQAATSRDKAVQELDELVACAKLTRQWSTSCSSCARTLATRDSKEEAEAAVLEQGTCHSCDTALNEFLLDTEPVYTPTTLVAASLLHEAAVEPGPRSRRSPLAERQQG
jgi:hypothetical protein